MIRTLLLAAALTLTAAARAQDSIRLVGSARVEAGRAVRLDDVAILTGAAQTLGDVAVLPAEQRGKGDTVIDIAAVRRALDAVGADRRVNWGRMTLAGSACRVVSATPVVAPPVAAHQGNSPPESGAVRHLLPGRLAQILGVSAQDLRVTFDEADRDVLDLSTAGRTVDARAVGASSRMPLAVTVYEGDRIVAARTVRADVQVRRQVVLASVARKRGELIGPEDVTTETQWLGPGIRTASRDDVVGAAVKNGIAPGQIVGPQDIEAPIIVRKGEVVAVHCVVGAFVLRTTARATTAGRDGDTLKFESLTDPGRTFLARMDGRGRAVTLQGSTDPQETP
jgi:flagella basal body P-ring formation protein FlgA